MTRMHIANFSDNCPKWLKLQVEASYYCCVVVKQLRTADNLPWLDQINIHIRINRLNY